MAKLIRTDGAPSSAMDPTERIIAVIEGRELDRVQTLSVLLDDNPIQQVLGRPLIKDKYLFFNPLSRYILDRWGLKLNAIVQGVIEDMMLRTVEASAALHYDAIWLYYEKEMMIYDSKTLLGVWGNYYDFIDDGHGNLWYMYREPAITSPEAYEAWPFFPDSDDWAQKTYNFFKKALSKYGERICIVGETPTMLYENMQDAMGFANLAISMRKNPDFIRRYIARIEEAAMKTTMAMMDAGLRVIMKGDDFGFKTGPVMNPKTFDEFYGPPYARLCKAVHDRGGKILIHSCGDNTELFDYFIKWGFDGGHAFENTSNVDIPYEKKTHGDSFTIVGGVGVDYHLTRDSSPEEVAEATREIIRVCAPGSRFILAPVHSHPEMDMSKVKVMLETAWEYGKYPINIQN